MSYRGKVSELGRFGVAVVDFSFLLYVLLLFFLLLPIPASAVNDGVRISQRVFTFPAFHFLLDDGFGQLLARFLRILIDALNPSSLRIHSHQRHRGQVAPLQPAFRQCSALLTSPDCFVRQRLLHVC